MLPFLIVLLMAALIIVFGVSVSYFLYSRGVVGRARRVKTFVTEPVLGDEGDGDGNEFHMSTGVLPDATSRYARTALFVLVGVVVFIVFFIVMLLH